MSRGLPLCKGVESVSKRLHCEDPGVSAIRPREVVAPLVGSLWNRAVRGYASCSLGWLRWNTANAFLGSVPSLLISRRMPRTDTSAFGGEKVHRAGPTQIKAPDRRWPSSPIQRTEPSRADPRSDVAQRSLVARGTPNARTHVIELSRPAKRRSGVPLPQSARRPGTGTSYGAACKPSRYFAKQRATP